MRLEHRCSGRFRSNNMNHKRQYTIKIRYVNGPHDVVLTGLVIQPYVLQYTTKLQHLYGANGLQLVMFYLCTIVILPCSSGLVRPGSGCFRTECDPETALYNTVRLHFNLPWTLFSDEIKTRETLL